MDLVELKVGGHKNDVIIQITADKPSGGITIRECAILNKSLVAAIEQENVLPPEIFSLELSSPGLDRPLVTCKDFMRLKAQELHFWLNAHVGGKKEVQGILAEVGESALTIDVSERLNLNWYYLYLQLSKVSWSFKYLFNRIEQAREGWYGQ